MKRAVPWLVLLLGACGGCPPPSTGGDAGSPVDAGHVDAGPPDAARTDAGARDAGDAGAPDASPGDAAAVDAREPGDAGTDAGEPDAGSPPDASAPDGGADAGAVDAGSPDASADAGTPDGSAPVTLRLMAANLTSGNLQTYEAPGIRLVQAMVPDVVMMQEFNYGDNSDAAFQDLADQLLGPGSFFCREPGGDQIPNGIVSRWPITWCGQWDDPDASNRDFAVARVDVPGPVDLWAVSVHLLTSSAGTRDQEALTLVTAAQAALAEGDLLVVAGDFNTPARTEACLTTLSQIVVTAGPWPVDQQGNGFTNTSRTRAYDWVLANPDLDILETAARVGSGTYPDGFVLDSRVYTPLSEIPPVLAGDSAATNMQHMGVVRDFLLSP